MQLKFSWVLRFITLFVCEDLIGDSINVEQVKRNMESDSNKWNGKEAILISFQAS